MIYITSELKQIYLYIVLFTRNITQQEKYSLQMYDVSYKFEYTDFIFFSEIETLHKHVSKPQEVASNCT